MIFPYHPETSRLNGKELSGKPSRALLSLAVAFPLTACAPEEESTPPSETTHQDLHVSPYWVEYTAMQKTIEGVVDNQDGTLVSTGSEEDPFLDERTQGGNWDSDTDVLVDVGMLSYENEIFTVASGGDIEELLESSDVDFAPLGDALESVLQANDVDWCGEPEPGIDFTDRYLETFADEDNPLYETQDEYLESIEDYVDCGDGRI